MQRVQVPEARAGSRHAETDPLAVFFRKPEAFRVVAEGVPAKSQGARPARGRVVEQVSMRSCAQIVGGTQEQLVRRCEVLRPGSQAVYNAVGH